MGADSKKKAAPPPLPAPTETTDSTITSPTELDLESDLATDLSRPIEAKSSYSLPDDGTPVTIKTRQKHNRSQTSLLIEYFEGGKGPGASGEGSERRPSVRVRLTPSKNRKNDHIQITETRSRKASLTRKASASASATPTGPVFEGEGLSVLEGDDAHSMNSYVSATEESNVSHQPIDIEIDRRRRRPASPLIPTTESSKVSYQPGNMSEISAIPTDSFLDGSGPSSKSPERRRDKSPSRAGNVIAGATAGLAAAATADKVRSGRQDKERVVLPKTRDRDRERSERKHKSKSRTSSTSDKHRDEEKSSRRKSSRSHQESTVSAADSSVVSSGLTPSHRSDQYSVRSGTSKASSINNPKLLETVEDAIRRLILPELNALKREQSRNHGRRSSITSASGTSISRDDQESDKRRSGVSERSTKPREPRDREARNVLLESPEPSIVSQESTQEYSHDTDSPGHGNLKAAAAGAMVGGLGAAAMGHNEAREQRKRRRAEAKNRPADSYAEEYDDESEFHPRPPMPLMSEINPSELTRTSIMSAESDHPQSARGDTPSTHETTTGRAVGTSTDDNLTPTIEPATLAALGAHHHNVSHGDLRALPRTGTGATAEDFENGQYANNDDRRLEEEYDDYDEVDDDQYPYDGPAGFYYNQQDVPAPLRYEPYGLERRGLSPIPSVSGYTEGGSEVQQNRDSRVTQRTSGSFSPMKSPHYHAPGTPGSIPSNIMSRDFDQDERSLRSSGYDYRNPTESEIEGTSPGQAVRGIGANPNFVHIPMGVESAVASLVDGSMLDGSTMTDSARGSGGYGAHNSMRAYDEQGSRDPSRQHSVDQIHTKGGPVLSPSSPDASNSHASDFSRDRSQPRSTFAGEYELDQYGRKVPASQSSERHSPTASEAAITGAAVAAASKALRARERDMRTVDEDVERSYTGSPGNIPQRNKSFKERTLDGHQPANTPMHSVDRLDEYDRPRMGATGIPDAEDPLPEIGFYEQSNPSVVEGRLDGSRRSSQDWSGQRTPTQLVADRNQDDNSSLQETPKRSGHGLGTAAGVAAGAAAIATAAALASSHNRQPSQEHEDWQRNSDDRKRDTLVTNPFEGNSPHVNLPGLGDNVMSGSAPVYQNPGFGGDFGTRSPLHNKVDEGYISQGANKTPDHVRSKGKGVEFSQHINASNMDDPFYTPKGGRHLSGMSQGLGSPLFDPSTGAGIDRIESQDIVALMQHLMVRDAQRSARDTEILMTLVRSAAEMRESFEKIKHMIADSEDVIIREVEENTEKTVTRHLGGPRPFPGSVSGARSPMQTAGGSQAGTEELRTKKQNLFRRALKGLSTKGNNDLGRIEDMLMQLLTEVDTLKTQTAVRSGSAGAGGFTPPGADVQSFDNLQPAVQYEHDRGYEPEGHAGTSTASHASQSGHLSIPQARAGSKLGYDRKFSDHRISTVPEANEEDFEHRTPERGYQLQEQYANPEMANIARSRNVSGGSMSISTPPLPGPAQGSMSNENTPQDKSKKHKSSGSSNWFPKISRWSETTTSSVGRVFRSSKDSKKDADWSYDGDPHVDPYGDDKLHSGFSQDALPEPEDPKYKAHRDSLNLQHPRPRQQAHKVAIETQAEDYSVPRSPNSANWADSATSLNRLQGQAANMRPHRYSDMSASAQQEHQPQFWGSSPIPAALSPSGPPRPPKEPLDGRSTPQKSNRISKLQKGSPSPLPFHSVESGYGTATHASYNESPRLENRNLSGALGGVPARRPSGPRAMTPKSDDDRRRKRDTFGSIASQESETF